MTEKMRQRQAHYLPQEQRDAIEAFVSTQIAEMFRRAMIASGLSQMEVSRRLGVNPTSVQFLVSGRRRSSARVDTLRQFASAFGGEVVLTFTSPETPGTYATVGAFLDAISEARSVSIAQLARELNISRQGLAKLRLGKVNSQVRTLACIAVTLGGHLAIDILMPDTPAHVPDTAVPWTALAPHQQRICFLIADGLTNREIAAQTGQSLGSINVLVVRTYSMLGLTHGEDRPRRRLMAIVEQARRSPP